MQIFSTKIQDSFFVQRNVNKDDRGLFGELWRDDWVEGIKFCQTNIAESSLGVLRGMHFQTENPQGKLVTCLQGRILDVIFDLRPDSQTFMRGMSMLLTPVNCKSLYVPPGCAHGYVTLSNRSIVHYHCTTQYDKKSDKGVNWKSPEIMPLFGDCWRVRTVSSKDQALPFLSELMRSTNGNIFGQFG